MPLFAKRGAPSNARRGAAATKGGTLRGLLPLWRGGQKGRNQRKVPPSSLRVPSYPGGKYRFERPRSLRNSDFFRKTTSRRRTIPRASMIYQLADAEIDTSTREIRHR